MISLTDVLSWLEPMPDDAVVGTACDGNKCAVARYVQSRFPGNPNSWTEAFATFLSPTKMISHDQGVHALISALDSDAGGMHDITAGAVREVAARIIRLNQPAEAEGVLPS